MDLKKSNYQRILTNIEKLKILQNIISYKNKSSLESLLKILEDKATNSYVNMSKINMFKMDEWTF